VNYRTPSRRTFILGIALAGMVALIGLSLYSIVLMVQAAASFREFNSVPMARVEWIAQMEFAAARLGRTALAMSAVDDEGFREDQRRVFQDVEREYNASWSAVKASATTNRDGDRLRGDIDRTGPEAIRLLHEYIAITRSADYAHARHILRHEVNPAQKAWADAIRAYSDAQMAFVDQEVDRTIAQLKLGAILIGAVSCGSLMLLGYVAVLMNRRVIDVDLRQTRLRNEQLRQLAYFDQLTRLPNRSLVAEHVEKALTDHHERIALICFDLDNFKEINDTLGHATGDAVLKEIAGRLKGVIRKEDVLGRFGGDEFVLIHHEISGSTGEDAALRLAEALKPEVVVGGSSFQIKASFGVAHAPDDATSFSELLRCADVAMYEAKESGGGICRFEPSLSDRLRLRAEIAEDLRRALKTGIGLSIHYQPKFTLPDRVLDGAEALIRWHHPTKGPVSPGFFVAIAEERGLIVDLGDWVFAQACRQVRAWREMGCPLPGRMAINVSAKQLEIPGIADRLERFASEAGVSARDVEIELTESSLVKDVVRTLAVLSELRERGFTVAIDDFGTGFSSLVYLKRFEANRIKIDMAFVQGMLESKSDHAIVESVIAMSEALSMDTVAEGVETDEQLNALEILGCRYAQGYLFGRPVPPNQFESMWLANLAAQSRLQKSISH
jgi:diguanylate cyclase (GGDEF)-like protein